MNLHHEGLTLWFGTPDTPAPFEGAVAPRSGTSVVVGVHPASPTNSVSLRFRVDRGFIQVVPAREIRTDYARQFQYFTALFPRLATGERVEYVPVLSCAGRQVPAPQLMNRFQSYFYLEQR